MKIFTKKEAEKLVNGGDSNYYIEDGMLFYVNDDLSTKLIGEIKNEK